MALTGAPLFLLSLAEDMLLAAVPAVGFGMLFNAPRRGLGYGGLLGALGHGLRFGLLTAGAGMATATFFAALFIGCAGIALSHRLLAHPKVFTVAAIIPMVPGVPAYKAMIALLSLYEKGYSPEVMGIAVSSFLSTVAILGALTLGLTLPGMLFYRRRPVV